jgi:hypothetical protein
MLGPLFGWVLVRNRPPWGDEAHFLETVKLFGRGLSIELLRSYPEMSAPLTYLVYSAWSGIVGFETPALRLLSPFVAGVTILAWCAFLADVFRSRAVLLVSLATIVLNPYFLGLSVFVFTDMLSFLGLALTAVGVSRRRPWLAAIGLAVATCSRQYLAFVAIPVAGMVLVGRGGSKRWSWGVAAAAGMVPLGLLVLLWGGQLAPDSTVRDIYTSDGIGFDPHALSLYASVPAVYLFPLAGLVLWRRPMRPAHLVAASVAAAFVLVFPVQPSIAQIREGKLTVGFLHRLIDTIHQDTVENVVFATLAFANVLALASAFSWWSQVRRDGRTIDADLFVWLGTAAFLAVMPFSYMPWEKYALPLLMLQSVALAVAIDRDTSRASLLR